MPNLRNCIIPFNRSIYLYTALGYSIYYLI